MGQYILATGNNGAERLDLVENLFGEASREFLVGLGLRDGQRVLDVGCGTGTLTRWIAKRFLILAATELKAVVLSSGLLNKSEADRLLQAVEGMEPTPTAYYAPGRMAQVAGVVP